MAGVTLLLLLLRVPALFYCLHCFYSYALLISTCNPSSTIDGDTHSHTPTPPPTPRGTTTYTLPHLHARLTYGSAQGETKPQNHHVTAALRRTKHYILRRRGTSGPARRFAPEKKGAAPLSVTCFSNCFARPRDSRRSEDRRGRLISPIFYCSSPCRVYFLSPFQLHLEESPSSSIIESAVLRLAF